MCQRRSADVRRVIVDEFALGLAASVLALTLCVTTFWDG
jgi:hypothetical protein